MHNHKSCCKHENIKYCPECQNPYCVDCAREWKGVCTLQHYYYTPVTIPSVWPVPLNPTWTDIPYYTTSSTDYVYSGVTHLEHKCH